MGVGSFYSQANIYVRLLNLQSRFPSLGMASCNTMPKLRHTMTRIYLEAFPIPPSSLFLLLLRPSALHSMQQQRRREEARPLTSPSSCTSAFSVQSQHGSGADKKRRKADLIKLLRSGTKKFSSEVIILI